MPLREAGNRLIQLTFCFAGADWVADRYQPARHALARA